VEKATAFSFPGSFFAFSYFLPLLRFYIKKPLLAKKPGEAYIS
jgi:hypothetical protein